jgi:hypothetical protein
MKSRLYYESIRILKLELHSKVNVQWKAVTSNLNEVCDKVDKVLSEVPSKYYVNWDLLQTNMFASRD